MRNKLISSPINLTMKGLVKPSMLTANNKEDDFIIEEELESHEQSPTLKVASKCKLSN